MGRVQWLQCSRVISLKDYCCEWFVMQHTKVLLFGHQSESYEINNFLLVMKLMQRRSQAKARQLSAQHAQCSTIQVVIVAPSCLPSRVCVGGHPRGCHWCRLSSTSGCFKLFYPHLFPHYGPYAVLLHSTTCINRARENSPSCKAG
jgi:hypothetical protein